MPNYTLAQKIDALDALADCETLSEAAEKTGVTASTLSSWRNSERDLRREHNQRLRATAQRKMLHAQHQLAERTNEILAAMDAERISKAPLNQLSSALGVLIDRYLKLQDSLTEDDNGKTIIEFRHVNPDGTVSEIPYWATENSEQFGAVQGGSLWQTFRQNGASEAPVNGLRLPTWDEDMVASADVSDGRASVARLKEDDNSRNGS